MIPSSDPDSCLVKRVQESADSGAFNALYERYCNKVYNFCLAFTGNDEDAKDCTQDVFVKIYRSIGSFRSDSKFSTWIYSIMNNTCKDLVKKRSKRKAVLVIENERWQPESGGLNDPIGSYPNPHDEMTRKEMHDIFLLALHELKPSFRRVIILRDIEGRSYKEIAELTGRNLGTIRSSIARGRNQVAAYLNSYRHEL